MRNLLLTLLTLSLFFSCSKTAPTPAAPAPPDSSAIPPLQIPPSLSNPKPLDTVYDWVRIGRVTYTLLDICFTSNTAGFITNDSSLFVTHDNGNTWAKIPNTSYTFLFNLQFVDSQNGFVQGDNELGITHDGGNTWIFKTLPSSSGLYFQFINATTGFFDDWSQGIRKTLDAGDHWTIISTNTQHNYPFYFLDSLNGFSLNGGDFSKTTNGGLNWVLKTAQVSTASNGYLKMQFLDSSTGYCATPGGLVKTSDGGLTWVNCLPSSTSFMIPYFFDANNGYCIDSATIYKTTNGGQNWKTSCKLSGDRFSGFSFLDMNTGWASTFGGFVLRLK